MSVPPNIFAEWQERGSQNARRDLEAWLADNPDATRADAEVEAYKIAYEFSSAAAEGAVDYFNLNRDEVAGLGKFEAQPRYGMSEQVLTDWLHGGWDQNGPQGLLNALDVAVKQAGRDTVTWNAAQDPAGPMWGLVPGPKACSFCVVRAGNSAAYVVGGTPVPSEGPTRYHPNCNCQPVPVWPGQMPPYDAQGYYDMFEASRGNVGAGASLDEIAEQMRHDWADMVTDGVRPTLDSVRRALVLDGKTIAKLQASSVSGGSIDSNGQWDPGRIALQNQIIEGQFEGVTPYGPNDEKVVYFSIGGTGSGKGTLYGINSDLSGYPTVRVIDPMTGLPMSGAPFPGAVLLDQDAMKIQLPEVRQMRATQQANSSLAGQQGEGADWARQAHEESSYMTKLAYQAALDRNLPIVFDGTGDGGIDSVLKKIQQAKDAGYKVKAAGVYLEPSEGLARANSRAAGTGRNVPIDIQSHIYSDIPVTFNQAMDLGLFDSVVFLDNNGVGKGEAARVIYEYTADGGVKILDQVAWDLFLSSADRV